MDASSTKLSCLLCAGLLAALALACSSNSSKSPHGDGATAYDINLTFADSAPNDAAGDGADPTSDATGIDWRPPEDVLPHVQDSTPTPCDKPGDKQDCDTGALGVCKDGQRRCKQGFWTACLPIQGATPELCTGGVDEDCDGATDVIDADCPCNQGATKPCATSLPGACSQGDIVCIDAGGVWVWDDSCTARYQVGERAEICDVQSNSEDVDCDGLLPGVDPDCTCFDGTENNGETGLDCGGPCALCLGDSCVDPTDCVSGFCVGQTCVDACHNLVQDSGELDVDCGGSCGLCGPGQNCNATLDCEVGLICNVSGKCAYPASCDALAAASGGRSLPEGPYSLLPSGATSPVPSRCEFNTDGGGWSLIQRTVWQWAGQSDALDTAFSAFYNQTIGQVSGAYRMAGRYWSSLATKKEMLVVLTLRKSDGTSCQPLLHKGTNISFAADTANSSFTISCDPWPLLFLLDTVTSAELSTKTTGPHASTVTSLEMLPWFIGSVLYCFTCPAVGGSIWSDAPHPTVYLYTVSDPYADLAGNYAADVCAPDDPDTSGAEGWAGLNVLEFYLR